MLTCHFPFDIKYTLSSRHRRQEPSGEIIHFQNVRDVTDSRLMSPLLPPPHPSLFTESKIAHSSPAISAVFTQKKNSYQISECGARQDTWEGIQHWEAERNMIGPTPSFLIRATFIWKFGIFFNSLTSRLKGFLHTGSVTAGRPGDFALLTGIWRLKERQSDP